MKSILGLGFLLSTFFASAGETLYFESVTGNETTRVVLYFEGKEVSGMQTWEIPDTHGTQGSLKGRQEDGGILRLVHRYTIEGSDQAEEVIYKLDERGLLIGEGELAEDRDGVLRLMDPGKVKFTKTLGRVQVSEPAPGSPERKEIMEAMRGPISAYIGNRVQFTGEVQTYRGWGIFSGDVATADGKAPADPDAAFALEMDFLALLKKDPEGRWQMLDWGFSGDTGVSDEFRSAYGAVPWVLLP
ncbi:MAG: hypothetical protein KDN18_23760 [Verrucomicrobiae bacterium]|nr:hypothetical protein [Verrucomicrobiae bacterium]